MKKVRKGDKLFGFLFCFVLFCFVCLFVCVCFLFCFVLFCIVHLCFLALLDMVLVLHP